VGVAAWKNSRQDSRLPDSVLYNQVFHEVQDWKIRWRDKAKTLFTIGQTKFRVHYVTHTEQRARLFLLQKVALQTGGQCAAEGSTICSHQVNHNHDSVLSLSCFDN